MKYQYRKYIFLTCLSVTLFAVANAQNIVWTGAIDSSWHNPGNWDTNSLPTSSSVVKIRNATPYPVITSNVTITSIVINEYWGSGKLTIRNNATLTITNTFSIYGNGVLHVVNGHVNLNNPSGTFDMNSGMINLENGSFSSKPNVTLNGTFSAGSSSVHFYGNFTASSSKTFNVQNANVTIDGSTTINGTYNGDDGLTDFNGSCTVRSGGVINLDTGIINFDANTTISNNGTANFGSGTVNIVGDITVSSGGYLNVQNAVLNVTGNADFINNGNLSVDGGTINISGNATLSSGGDIDINEGTLAIGGDASFTNGGTVDAGGGDIILEGDLVINTGGTFNADSSTVTFSGDSTQVINTGGGDITFFNVVVDSGATVHTDGETGNTVIIVNDLVVDEESSIEVIGNDQLDVQGNIDSGGEVTSTNPYAVSVTTPSLTSVIVTFDQKMDEATIENIANYVIDNGITVSGATLNLIDSMRVTLVVSTLTEGIEYKLTMNNIKNIYGNPISTNHIKKFTVAVSITFYSRQNGNWNVNTTWSISSHTGAAATSNPGNTTNTTVIIGNGNTVTIASNTSLSNQTAVTVNSGSTLILGSGGTLETNNKVLTGAGSFIVSTGTLKIGSPMGISSSGSTGNIQTSTRTYGNSGSYVYNGSSTQTTGTGLPGQVANLTIDNSSGVTLSDDIKVTGTLTLANGSLVLPSGSNLIANTKSISSGNLKFKHQITGSKGWRLLSSPIASTYQDLLDSIVTQGYPGAYYGTGSNPGDTLQPNIMYYLESYEGTDNQRWRAPASASTNLTEGRGLYTYIFGDISGDTKYNNPFPRMLQVEGQENEGAGNNVDFGVTYTASADSGWNLVGNPYAATIDWDNATEWTKTNIDNTIYIWDPVTGQYKTWNGTTGDLATGLISPFQGFWVKANASTPSLIVNENAKTTGGTFVGKINPETEPDAPKLTLTLADDHKKVSTHFMFSENAKLGKDRSDGYRLLPPPGNGDYLELSSVSENGDLFSINNLPRKFGIPIEIMLNIDAFSDGYSTSKPLNFKITKFENIPEGWTISLKDSDTGEVVPVEDQGLYLFNFEAFKGKEAPNKAMTSQPKITSKNKSKKNRFSLILDPGSDAIDTPQEFQVFQNYPNPFNPETHIRFSLALQSYVNLTIYDILGRQIATLVDDEVKAGIRTYTWNAAGLASGIYFYRLNISGKTYIKKMTLLK